MDQGLGTRGRWPVNSGFTSTWPLATLFPLLPQQFLQHPNSLVDVLLFHQERRQEPHHRILRAVEQHTLGQRRIHNRTRRNLQLNSLDKSPPAHSRRRRALFDQSLQLLPQIRSNFNHVLEHPLFLDNRQKLQRHAAGQRTTSERCPMLPRRNRRCEFFLRNERPQWQPRRNRLGNRHNVGRHAETLKRKNRSRPPQPALNLVEDQRHLVTIRQRPALAQKFHRTLINSALAKNRLQHNRARIVIHRRPQTLQIVLLHKRDIFQQRLKSLAMLVLPRERQCTKRAPMIRPFQRQQRRLRLTARAMPRQPRQLDRAFNRLGSRVRKERAIQPR